MAGGGIGREEVAPGLPHHRHPRPGRPSVRRLLPCPQEVLLKRAADLAEALYGVPSGNQVWRLRPPPRAGPGAARLPAPAAAPAVPALVFAGAPPEARGGRGRGSVQRPRAPAPLGPLAPSHPHPAVVGINAFSSPLAIAVGDATPGPEPGASAAARRPLPCGRAPLTAALPQGMRAAVAARPRAGSRPAPAHSRAATAAASELASAAMGPRA